MSEKRDLWVPVLVLVAGLAVAAWDVSAGRLLAASGALIVGVAGAAGTLRYTLARARLRAAAVAAGSGAFLAGFAPGLFPPVSALLCGLAALSVAGHPKTLPQSSRAWCLALAGVFVLLGGAFATGLVAGVRDLAWPCLAGALACVVIVWATRPRPESALPVGPEIGVFGGSFDPFHRAHRAICEAALKRVNRLLVVVAGNPPHKAGREVTPFHHRVAMARLGVEGLARTEVLELEGRREGPSYTVDTLDALRRLQPAGTRFRLVLGADSFEEFPLWHDWEGILERADLLVAARPGHDVAPPPEFEGRNAPVEVLETAAVGVSSTDLRRRLGAGLAVGEDVSPAVAAYVRDHGLYREGAQSPVAAPGEAGDAAGTGRAARPTGAP
jgi:nicotinate-nucleotide adenylyltransferase